MEGVSLVFIALAVNQTGEVCTKTKVEVKMLVGSLVGDAEEAMEIRTTENAGGNVERIIIHCDVLDVLPIGFDWGQGRDGGWVGWDQAGYG